MKKEKKQKKKRHGTKQKEKIECPKKTKEKRKARKKNSKKARKKGLKKAGGSKNDRGIGGTRVETRGTRGRKGQGQIRRGSKKNRAYSEKANIRLRVFLLVLTVGRQMKHTLIFEGYPKWWGCRGDSR